MNPAVRGGVILLICLLAVFPCGAALTVLGSAVAEALRPSANGGTLFQRLLSLWAPLLWAGGGILGFLFLVTGVDKLIAAKRRLPWYGLLAICLEIAAAGLFAATYPLRGSTALLFRLISLAPVAIGLALLIHHIIRAAMRPSAPAAPPPAREVSTSSASR